MHDHLKHVSLLFRRLTWLLILYSLSRLFYHLVNLSYFSGLTAREIMVIYAAGIRFDLAAILFTNALLFIPMLLPGNYKNNPVFMRVVDCIFLFVNAVAILGNFADARFFSFIDKRSTAAVFYLFSTDKGIWSLMPQFLKDYWYVALAWVVLMAAAIPFRPKLRTGQLKGKQLRPADVAGQLAILVVMLGFFLWGVRGTGLKPISIIDAADYTEVRNIPLLINTPFSIIKTLDSNKLQEHEYLSAEELRRIYDPVHLPSGVGDMRRLNVVLVILESFSSEYTGFYSKGQGYTPALDSLLDRSLVFENSFANGTQSNEALPAILAGIPTLMERPYSGSSYASNLIQSLPGMLRNEGYATAFFHGGSNGTMNFDKFCRIAGIEKYYGRNEYNNEADFDGKWGIWDEPYLQYAARELDHFTQPFFAGIFTLSSHHPYSVPRIYEGMFAEGELPIHRSVAYADHALKKFFSYVSGRPWFSNTLFVFTADHAAQSLDPFYDTGAGRYAVPIAFYCPSDSLLRGVNPAVAQQIDIMPTVLSYLRYPGPFFSFGNDLLNPDAEHFAVSYLNGIYQLISGDKLLSFDGSRVLSFTTWKNAGLQTQEGRHPHVAMETTEPANPGDSSLHEQARVISEDKMEKLLKAIIQTYNTALNYNRMTP